MHGMHERRSTRPELKRISAVVQRDHCDRLTEIAKRNHRTFSQELRRIIEEAVEADQSQAAA